MDVRQKLSLIPRPIVKLVPRSLRDRLRSTLLARERQRQRRAPEVNTRVNGRLGGIERRCDAVETKLDAVLVGLADLQRGIEQLDARLTPDRSGDAPSVVDDLRELVAPIEELSQQLRSSRSDTDVPAAETRHAAS